MISTSQEPSYEVDEKLIDLFARVFRHLRTDSTGGIKDTCTYLHETYRKVTQGEELVIGVYGRPKMGKSTLLNTILGEPILPVSVIPMTGSVIDIKCSDDSEYVLFCKVNQSNAAYLRLPTAKAVCDYLSRHGSQTNPFDCIEISGPFPKALPFMKPNYILRDTPGFERLLSSESAPNERLREDTAKTIASLDRPDLYLFCVSADTPGQDQDLQLYDEYFRKHFCVHIMTHCEDVPEKSLTKLRNDFYRDFRLLPDEFDQKPLVCTGISNYAERDEDDLVLDVGREDMVREVQNGLTPEKILERIRSICHFITEQPGKVGAGSVPKVHLSALKSHLKHYYTR